MKQESWEGPFQLRDCLNRQGGWPKDCLPPEVPGLYVATKESWSDRPPEEPPPLCVGKAYAQKSGGLRSRIGDFISSLGGFHGDNDTSAGRHAEGIRISKEYCRNGAQNPLDIYVAWRAMPRVSKDLLDEEETRLIERTMPTYNKHKKPKCGHCQHSSEDHRRMDVLGRCGKCSCQAFERPRRS